MKEYKYKIDGKEYVVAIGEIVNNVADVTVNGEIFSVEMEAEPEPEKKKVVIEQYVTGTEMCAVYNLSDGDIELALLNDKYQLISNNKRTVLCNATVVPSVHLDDFLKKADQPIKRFLHGIGAENGMVFFQMMLLIFVFGPGIAITNYGDKKEKEKGKGSVIRNIFNHNTVAALLGILVMVTGLKLPELVMKPVGLIGDITTVISMLVIGIQLGTSNFRKIRGNRALMTESILKMLLVPVITFLLVNWLPISSVIKLALVFGAAFPSAVIVSPIAFTEGKDGTLAAEGVALTTLISVITIPAAALILSAIYL